MKRIALSKCERCNIFYYMDRIRWLVSLKFVMCAYSQWKLYEVITLHIEHRADKSQGKRKPYSIFILLHNPIQLINLSSHLDVSVCDYIKMIILLIWLLWNRLLLRSRWSNPRKRSMLCRVLLSSWSNQSFAAKLWLSTGLLLSNGLRPANHVWKRWGPV